MGEQEKGPPYSYQLSTLFPYLRQHYTWIWSEKCLQLLANVRRWFYWIPWKGQTKDVDARSLYLKHLPSDLIWTFVLWLEELLHQNDPRTPKKAGVTSREKMSSYVADALIPRSTQHNSPPSRICHSLPEPPADCEKKDHTWQDDSNLSDLWLCFLVDLLVSSEVKHWRVQVSQNSPTCTFNPFCWRVCARRVSTLNEEVVDVLSEGARGKTGKWQASTLPESCSQEIILF